MHVYDEKYIKGKVRKFNGVIKAIFSGDEIPKENAHCVCITCFTNDPVMTMEKKELFASLFTRVPIQNEKNKDAQIHKH